MIEIPSLKEMRIIRGLAQKQVARRMGAPLRSYQRYENGETSLPMARIIPLARALNVSPAEIIYVCSKMEAVDATEVSGV